MGMRGQYITIAVLSLAAIAFAFGLQGLGSDAFVRFLGPGHPALAIALLALAALPAVRLLMRRHGFGGIASKRNGRGLAVSAGVGAVFAAAVIAVDLGLRYPETINVPFPESLLFYPAIGLVVELLLHATLLAALLLALRPLAHRVGEDRVVWLGIVLAATVEPALQVAWAGSLSWTELYTAVSVFLFGATEMAIFRRFGFGPMYAMRLSFYLLWHIAWGHVRLDLLF